MFEKRHFQEKLWTRNISFKKTSKLFYNIEPVIINYQLKLQDGVTKKDVIKSVHCVIKTLVDEYYYVMECQVFSLFRIWDID